MGWFMKEHDIYIGSMLDELNLRFAPPQGLATHYGGLDEMVALQKEFKILKKGRAFRTSVAVLNLCSRNNEVKIAGLICWAHLASMSPMCPG